MKALVTGGGGFLGSAIVRLLVARGAAVRSFSRGDYPELRQRGVELIRGDIADPSAVRAATAGCDVVFHVAAKPGIWGPYKEYHRVNVTGTENVLAACRQEKVGQLVYTSSPSVVFDGSDMEGVDESVPYPAHYEAAYPQTKAIAERLVLAANGPALATVALRPHFIWGPGDNHLIPRILARARAGRLFRLGRRDHKVDAVFVDDAAAAHILAADRLYSGSPIAGKVYFITQDEPWPLWDVVNGILDAAGLPPVTRSVPPTLAYVVGWTLERIYRLLGVQREPPMTGFLARELATAHWFNVEAARRDLGYAPGRSMKEGMELLREWFRQNGGCLSAQPASAQ
jgi:nucleoside-diphosphate-sugar epimerase